MSKQRTAVAAPRAQRIASKLRGLVRSAWFFPVLLLSIVFILGCLEISGSSIAIYDGLLGVKDPNLILGSPKADRSDEWLVNTPLTLSQRANNYKTKNPDIGQGNDMAITVDVPYKEWSIIFKPQNLPFFVLPFAMAFALKWWLLVATLMLAVYWLTITVFPKRYLLASLLAIFFGFNPYIQWWYQSITILSVAYPIILVTLGLRILKAERLRTKLLLSGGLAYGGVCFALLLYPPYQISCALVGVGFFAAVYLASLRKKFKRELFDQLAWLGIPLVISVIAIILFLITHRQAVLAEAHTVYPGHRTVQSGGLSFAYMSMWPLAYLLLRGGPISVFGTNQSESANCLLFGLLLIPYLIYRIWSLYRSADIKARTEQLRVQAYLTIACCVVLLLFFVQMFTPIGTTFYHLVGLGSTPHNRLLLAIGLVNVMLLAITVTLPAKKFTGLRSIWSWPALSMAALAFVFLLAGLRAVKHTYGLPPDVGRIELVLIAFICSCIVWLFCSNIRFLRYAGLVAVVVYALFSALPVNPLYRGISALAQNPVSHMIKQASDANPTGRWIVVNKITLEALPVSQGVPSISGLYPYPQTKLWSRYFPQNSFIYNRFAHVTFDINDAVPSRSMTLVQGDTFKVTTNSCDPLLKNLNVAYLLTADPSITSYNCYREKVSIPIGSTPVTVFQRKN